VVLDKGPPVCDSDILSIAVVCHLLNGFWEGCVELKQYVENRTLS